MHDAECVQFLPRDITVDYNGRPGMYIQDCSDNATVESYKDTKSNSRALKLSKR